MSHTHCVRRLFSCTIAAMTLLFAAEACAQNQAPNPFRAVDGIWGKLPAGRLWGATSAVYPAQDGSGNIWVAERCGKNTCIDVHDVPPVLLFSPSGELLKSFGGGMIVWPHGIFVDSENNVWIADARGGEGRGHQVYKFSEYGELLMSLGVAGVAGEGETIFNQPSDVLVAPDGSIFVADGHGTRGNNRIVKFAGDGKFAKAWGKTGYGPGEFRDPHALALDSQGRLFVGDRANSRIQIFTQDGEHIATWTQFGRPSGLFIDANDILYSADSESNATWAGNPGWKRGIRIGTIKDGGWVTGFIPDPVEDQDNADTTGAEGVAVDAQGNVYGAEVGPKMLRKYVRR
jgi:DNA-binding beta-propeller fold protein YncE